MRTACLSAFVLSIVTTSAWASPGLHAATYIVDETSYYSEQFRADCDSAQQAAYDRLPIAEKNLGLEAGTLSLHSGIATLPVGPGNPNPGMPGQQVRYQCLLQYTSKDKAVTFTLDTSKMKTHLAKEVWDTACKADQDELTAHPGSLFTQYEQGYTLFQGRICDVGYVEAVKKP